MAISGSAVSIRASVWAEMAVARMLLPVDQKYGNVTARDRLDLEIRDTEFSAARPLRLRQTTTLNVIVNLRLTAGGGNFDDR
jgi:hypothetical protein